jgi:hypothetical protein
MEGFCNNHYWKLTMERVWLTRLFFIAMLFGVTLTSYAQKKKAVQLPAETAFATYFNKVQKFAVDYPREKVYLHFDNNSYYQGDTIWYKAYVVTAADNQPSTISTPLYVDFLDQLGNVTDRQIIQLNHGEGSGYISLATTFITGYYEVRAYTKWMLAFDDPQYFSRVLPVYRKRLNTEEARRQIAKYDMDDLMQQRPKEKLKKLNVRFFPEGGRLIQDVPTIVGWEVMSPDSGWVDMQGLLLDGKGKDQRQIPVATIHDGMGSFVYTPGSSRGEVELTFNGKRQTFDLPKAERTGYALHVKTCPQDIEVNVSRNAATQADTVAVFVFSDGVPRTYATLKFGSELQQSLRVRTDSLSAGIVRVALVDKTGATLSDRFTFVYPKEPMKMTGTTDTKLYDPFRHIRVKVKLNDAKGQPVRDANVSMAVRSGIDFDYDSRQDNIFTDLLLTSGLKGYIHQPAFYFEDQSRMRQTMLDNLLLIRGWRQYDLRDVVGPKVVSPRYEPEAQQTLCGRIMKNKKPQKGTNVGVYALRAVSKDTLLISGVTKCDSAGYFKFGFNGQMYGKWNAFILSHLEGYKIGRQTNMYLLRNFEPDKRVLDFDELHPRWDEPLHYHEACSELERIEESVKDNGAVTLNQVDVTAVNKMREQLRATEEFERRILAYYDVDRFVTRQRDNCEPVADNVADLLHDMNKKILARHEAFDIEFALIFGVPEGVDYNIYRGKRIKYHVGGRAADEPRLLRTIDKMKTALIYMDTFGEAVAFSDNFRVKYQDALDLSTDIAIHGYDWKSHRATIRCNFTMKPDWKHYINMQEHGIRHLEIQGYQEPVSFYLPAYPEMNGTEFAKDYRRTLYWNPNVKTDANGEATIECYNARNATFLDVSAETLVGGKPAAVEFTSLTKK